MKSKITRGDPIFPIFQLSSIENGFNWSNIQYSFIPAYLGHPGNPINLAEAYFIFNFPNLILANLTLNFGNIQYRTLAVLSYHKSRGVRIIFLID